jgi:hypothetical protein
MMLEYGKAVQESVYEQLRVVREGQLRIIFSHDLKVNEDSNLIFRCLSVSIFCKLPASTFLLLQILSWEFCARRHEELLPRRLVAPQVLCLHTFLTLALFWFDVMNVS